MSLEDLPLISFRNVSPLGVRIISEDSIKEELLGSIMFLFEPENATNFPGGNFEKIWVRFEEVAKNPLYDMGSVLSRVVSLVSIGFKFEEILGVLDRIIIAGWQ